MKYNYKAPKTHFLHESKDYPAAAVGAAGWLAMRFLELMGYGWPGQKPQESDRVLSINRLPNLLRVDVGLLARPLLSRVRSSYLDPGTPFQELPAGDAILHHAVEERRAFH